MPREKKKPDLSSEVLGINPFAENLSIAVTKKAQKVLNKFNEVDEREYELEATPYTKVFQVEDGSDQICDLAIRSQQLYLYIIHVIKSAQDYIWIDRAEYMKRMEIKSVNTYKEAVRVLAENMYIYPHVTLKDVYWVNPHYIFKGSRINKYKEKTLVREPKNKKS